MKKHINTHTFLNRTKMKNIFSLFSAALQIVLIPILFGNTASAQALWTNDSVSITVQTGMTVTIGGDMVNQGQFNLDINGQMELTGDWTNNDSLYQDTGQVGFVGINRQTITGSNEFYNILINSGDTVNLASKTRIGKEMKIDLGVLDATTDTALFKSNSSVTARLAEIPAGANFVGDIVMERYVPAGVTGYRFISSAVAGATVAEWDETMVLSIPDGNEGCAATPQTGCWYSVRRYDETLTDVSDTGYYGITTVAHTISSGVGYLIYHGTTPTNTPAYTFATAGTPNKFGTALPVTYNSTPLTDHDGWNLVGNPYPSAIDWDAAGWTKSNINNAIYIWDPNGGVYASYVAGVGTNGGAKEIASSQAFWVKATANPPALTITETVKTSVEPTYFKQSGNISNIFRMSIEGGGYIDETVIRFKDDATDGFDGEYDAYKMTVPNSVAPNISTLIGADKDLSINSLGPLTVSIIIPVRATVPSTGNYTIVAGDFDDMPTTSCILLEDLLTGVFTNLRTTNTYTFNISASTTAPRFLLHIGAPVSGEAFDVVCKGDDDGIGIASGSGSGPWNYLWENLQGNALQNNLNVAGSDDITNLAPGTYIFTVEDATGLCATHSDTITITEPSNLLEVNSTSNDVSCNGDTDGSILSNVIGGVPPYVYSWSNGDSTENLMNLSGGTYTLTVTDQNACVKSRTEIIDDPLAISYSSANTDVLCFGDNSGSIDLSVNGGTAPYQYAWSNGESTEDLSSLDAGIYSVTITDNNNCTQVSSPIEIVDGMQVIAGITSSSTTVYLNDGAEVQFNSLSIGATTYLWDFGDGNTSTDKNPLHAYITTGTYTVTHTAFNGTCSDAQSDIIVVLETTGAFAIIENLDEVLITQENNNVIVKFNLLRRSQAEIEVFNSVGQLITSMTTNVKRSDVRLDLPQLADGIYLVNVNTKEVSLTKKVLLNVGY
ncbi:MAG: hypothetical protein COB85_04320 [Bacteroidetes bacterium]|nr:MAG: hypothetical protein COB85_04320 [Bacteroidota bacterium]